MLVIDKEWQWIGRMGELRELGVDEMSIEQGTSLKEEWKFFIE